MGLDFSHVYHFRNSQIENSPSFITDVKKPPHFLWAQESFQKTSQKIEDFYKVFETQKKKIFKKDGQKRWPQESRFFVYQIDKDQKFQMDFSESTDETSCIHNFIFLKEGVCLYLFENESLPWVVNHIYLSPRSKVFRFKTTKRSHRCFVFSKLCEESCFFNFELNVNSKESYVLMEGQGENCVGISRSLNLLNEDQVVFEKAEHRQKAQKGLTRQFFRNVLGGKSLARVHSMTLIEAQEVNSHQLLQSLLLSEGARSENKPELKVFKDQVQATHGSTMGTLQDLEVFYLNSRGISEEEARQILIEAWVSKIFDTQDLTELKENENSQKFITDFIQEIRSSFEPELKKKLSSF